MDTEPQKTISNKGRSMRYLFLPLLCLASCSQQPTQEQLLASREIQFLPPKPRTEKPRSFESSLQSFPPLPKPDNEPKITFEKRREDNETFSERKRRKRARNDSKTAAESNRRGDWIHKNGKTTFEPVETYSIQWEWNWN